MPVIKRYPNRKLYDTETKQYITLEGIAELIRQGQEVQVIDNASGEDQTALTLTQIIFEQEKKQGGWLSRSALASIIQSGGDRLNILQRSLASPINLLHQIDEEIKRRIQVLVKEGDLSEGEGQNLVEKLLAQRFRPMGATSIDDETVEKVLKTRQVPTRQDLQQLQEHLETLASRLDEIGSSDPAPDTQ